LFFQELAEKRGIRHFAFYDDALLVSKETVFQPFLREVIDKGPACSFYLPNALHLRLLDEETLDLMIQAGFRELRFGFESADADFHMKMDDKIGRGDLDYLGDLLDKCDFPREAAHLYTLAGLPGQRREEVEATLRFAADRGFRCRIASYSPVPGSSLWPQALALSHFPLQEEPLFHNNSLQPLAWDGFTVQDMSDLRALSLTLARRAPSRKNR
jgi:radical SAM superfamily enzyme YgiQ (UPF0313 family)